MSNSVSTEVSTFAVIQICCSSLKSSPKITVMSEVIFLHSTLALISWFCRISKSLFMPFRKCFLYSQQHQLNMKCNLYSISTSPASLQILLSRSFCYSVDFTECESAVRQCGVYFVPSLNFKENSDIYSQESFSLLHPIKLQEIILDLLGSFFLLNPLP